MSDGGIWGAVDGMGPDAFPENDPFWPILEMIARQGFCEKIILIIFCFGL